MHIAQDIEKYIHRFSNPIETALLNKELNSPFHYTPDSLALAAVEQVQEYLESQDDWHHDFGLTKPKASSMGKMFGVLVVIDENGVPGFLVAFSGKLAGKVNLQNFVPPIYDMLYEDGFYRKGEELLNQLNLKIEELENDSNLLKLKKEHEALILAAECEIEKVKNDFKSSKIKRKEQRDNLNEALSDEKKQEILENLNNQSKEAHRIYKRLTAQWKEEIRKHSTLYEAASDEINNLKQMRREKSMSLQDELFSKYVFLNSKLEQKGVLELFQHVEKPPSGAGDCAAPKLLQFAFKYKLRPISIAEFWWGISPSSEIRTHKNFYPACKGKCEPILNHMLEGFDLENPSKYFRKEEAIFLEIIFEDENILVINKPENLLSVPGKIVADSVYSILKKKYPYSTGPLLVHRLDMATSGILLIAKSMEIYQLLQQQFINRQVKKSYVAVLEGIVKDSQGEINLPLRVDHYDRPRQMVDFEHGKQAITKWEVLEHLENSTRIRFFPITGRTHQLRVHAAHHLGLNIPIKGDDIYGLESTRLHLHAESLEIMHPVKHETLSFISPCPF
jgi:tRNA pseudouridine32 synthase/23S rRNA pseudouridine746 synthase